jgi:hypothetical protein
MKSDLAVAAAVAALAPLVGCGGGDPDLKNLTFRGQAPDSPLVLLLSVDFTDSDGDLAGERGRLETFINQRGAESLPFTSLFVDNGLDPGATAGTLDFVLEIAFADEVPASGTTFTLGARAVDGAGNASDIQEIKLKIEGSE